MKSYIRLLHSHIFFLRRSVNDPALLWQTLAGLQALLSIWLISSTQRDQGITLLAIVVWGGAAICFEDELAKLKIHPSRSSLMAGLVLLIYASLRSIKVLDLDSMVYVLPVIQGLGLGLISSPLHQLWRFRQPLFVLCLFPLHFVAFKLLPEYWLSITTGKVGQIILLLFGVQSTSVGRMFRIGNAGVSIQPACSGSGAIAQLVVIAIVFVMAYPIRSVKAKFIFILISPILGYLMNAVRITILAVILGSSLPQKEQLFDFMHEEWGGLIFSGISTIALGQIYMWLINRQLTKNHA